MKLINCFALASSGAWFTDETNLQAFHANNPEVFTTKIGDRQRIHNRSLLSYGTEGTVVGFDRTPAGKILVLLRWHPQAAPLRVSIGAIMRTPPRKFWMAIPFNERYRQQAGSFDSNSRRSGTAPAVARFDSLQSAQEYVDRERTIAGYGDFVILESTNFSVMNGTLIPM